MIRVPPTRKATFAHIGSSGRKLPEPESLGSTPTTTVRPPACVPRLAALVLQPAALSLQPRLFRRLLRSSSSRTRSSAACVPLLPVLPTVLPQPLHAVCAPLPLALPAEPPQPPQAVYAPLPAEPAPRLRGHVPPDPVSFVPPLAELLQRLLSCSDGLACIRDTGLRSLSAPANCGRTGSDGLLLYTQCFSAVSSARGHSRSVKSTY